MKVLVALAFLLLVACGTGQREAIKVDIASLLATPERFAGKRVELEAILLIDFELMVAMDPSGDIRENIWFDYAEYSSDQRESRGFSILEAAFVALHKKEVMPFRSSARARVVGIFEHSNLPSFGHQGSFRSKLLIEKILEAAPHQERPNQALQPTRMLVTFRAYARPAPSTRVADL